jgi:DNA-binding SARP family transcriptional activator/Tol biopolymer transport system component
MHVELRLLGSLRLVSSDGRDLDPLLRQSKRVALLAYLAAATPRGFHRRDTLLGIFWPELDQMHARSALNQSLYVLRSVLGDSAIVTRGPGEVGVHPGAVWCDATEFEAQVDAGAAGDALALYRGDFLDGFFIESAPDFERWQDAQRTRFRLRASEAAWSLAEQQALAGALAEAARLARRAADLVPDDETVVRRLMTFFHRLGDRAAALRAYDAFVWRLERELELAPSAETRALADVIRHETSDTVATQLARILPAPFAALLHRIDRKLPFGWMLAGAMSLVVFAAGVWNGLRASQPAMTQVVRFTVEPHDHAVVSSGVVGSPIAMAPDGATLVYLAETAQGNQLFSRRLDAREATPIRHTRAAYLPFFSPKGDWIAFVADGVIQKVPVGGGPSIPICRVGESVMGASWGDDDVIVFATANALWKVSAGGGSATLLAASDTARGIRYRWPEVVPGGRAALFTIVDRRGFGLAAISLQDGAMTQLGIEGASPRFASESQLVFARADGALLSADFDAASLRVTGDGFAIAEGIMVGSLGAAKIAVSRTGAFAYAPENLADRSLVLVDRRGATSDVPVPPQRFVQARLSPDDARIAAEIMLGGSSRDLWIFDLLRHTSTRLTHDSGSLSPLWWPDGSRIVFGTSAGGRNAGYAIRSLGTGARDSAITLLPAAVGQWPQTFAPDGRSLLVQRTGAQTKHDLWLVPLETEREATPYLQSSADERGAMISPDGRWLAYVSDESGSDAVYVRTLHAGGDAMRVSEGSAHEPRWSRTGRELLYRSDTGMVAATIATDPGLRVIARSRLFDDRPYVSLPNGTAYDVTRDGSRFLMIRKGGQAREIQVVLNGLARSREVRP